MIKVFAFFAPFVAVIFLTQCNRNGVVVNSAENLEIEERESFRIVFYNVENLFDVYDDPNTQDEEFTPRGLKGWNKVKYEDKLAKISKVMLNIGGWGMPEIIGVCEVENKDVLQDLVNETPLAKFNYQIVHEQSVDERGIDVGLLYDKTRFHYLHHEIIRHVFPFDAINATRDILYVKGLVKEADDTLHLFVNHWPSRRGGLEVSEPYRMYVAQRLKHKTDSLFRNNNNANIVIMGDFNDEPSNRSLSEGLAAKGDLAEVKNGDLYNFMYPLKNSKGLGTYKYQTFWNMLDHMIVSEALLDDEGTLRAHENAAQIFMPDWLYMDDEMNTGRRPFRTFGGSIYYQGYSDHFPVFLDLEIVK